MRKFRYCAWAFTVIVVTALATIIDYSVYTQVAFVSSVVSMLYFMYRLFVREVENVVYHVYEDKLKKEIRDEVREEVDRLYEEKIKKDIQEMLRNPK